MRKASFPMKNLKSYFELCKVSISLFAACSAATGYIMTSSSPKSMIVPVIGVFLLACGSSALNQYQERDIDARMERTRHRPVPAGDITARHAITVSLILITAGFIFLLYDGVGLIAFGLGLGAVLWYNGVYTFLKKRTAFAAVPGALVGSIPPAIGWISGGGVLFSPRLLALCLLFFLWQVPHFWLLILRHGREYEEAGLPSLSRLLSRSQISRITFAWVFATAAASLALPLYGMGNFRTVYFALVLAAVWLIANGAKLLRVKTTEPAVFAFRRINGYIFIVMLLLSIDRLLSPLP
jgi:protoheme IX farnesyltransferase